jgi:hypothetical protein
VEADAHSGRLTACAGLPVSGRPVPELQEDLGKEMNFANLMTDYMEKNEIRAGAPGVMKDGNIVHIRGFGHAYDGAGGAPGKPTAQAPTDRTLINRAQPLKCPRRCSARR